MNNKPAVAVTKTKQITLTTLLPIIRTLKQQGKKIVFTNGCFDLIHWGHVAYLNKAKSFGDVLIVGLNSDASVRRLKGPLRPLFPEKERAEVLSAFSAVDYVVLFSEETPLRCILTVKPDVLVKGGDYTVETIVGHEDVLARGGKVIPVPFIKGRSTTKIIKTISL